LSYTTFSLSGLSASRVGPDAITALPANGSIQPGGLPALWDVLYTVTATVKNTGSVAGAAVPQLYLGLPQPANQDVTPVKVLRGFDKVFLQPGESQSVTFNLTRRDISYWDIYNQQWTIGTSSIGVLAGFSSRDILATTSFTPLSSSNSSGGYGGGGWQGHGDKPGPWSWWTSDNHRSSSWKK
jgi:beta-glucosidase